MIRIRKRAFLAFVIFLIALVSSSILFFHARYIIIKTIQIPVSIIHSVLNQTRLLFTLRAISFDINNYNELKEEHSLLKAGYDELLQENNRLRKLLELKKESNPRYVAAKVIFADASNWSWGIIVNQGKGAGIKRDDPVVTHDGLAGKVIDVWGDASHVLLLNDPDFAAAAMIKSTRDNGVVIGSLDGSCRMIYVSGIADIKEGEEVITSGMMSIFPKGIPIGKVVSVQRDYSGSLYFIIKPNVNLERIEEALIIKR